MALWTMQGSLIHGSTVDSIVDGGRGSPKLGLAAAPMHGGSPAMEQWKKEHVGSQSQASPG
jgi:hypothetical protein